VSAPKMNPKWVAPFLSALSPIKGIRIFPSSFFIYK
jgi:hypothetical protein